MAGWCVFVCVCQVCEGVSGYHKSGASEGAYRTLVDAFSAKHSLADLAAAAPTATAGEPNLPSEGEKEAPPVVDDQASLYHDALPASHVSLFWINLRRSWIQQTR
jgi:hypothetical protein